MDRGDEGQQKRPRALQQIELSKSPKERPSHQPSGPHELYQRLCVQGEVGKETLQAHQREFFQTQYNQMPRRSRQALRQAISQPPTAEHQLLQAQQQAFFGGQPKQRAIESCSATTGIELDCRNINYDKSSKMFSDCSSLWCKRPNASSN